MDDLAENMSSGCVFSAVVVVVFAVDGFLEVELSVGIRELMMVVVFQSHPRCGPSTRTFSIPQIPQVLLRGDG